MYMAALKALPVSEAKRKTQELLAMVGLEENSKKKIKTLSGGMVRRLGIAQAMLNDPEILILDEPTSGLDPKMCIRDSKRRGRYPGRYQNHNSTWHVRLQRHHLPDRPEHHRRIRNTQRSPGVCSCPDGLRIYRYISGCRQNRHGIGGADTCLLYTSYPSERLPNYIISRKRVKRTSSHGTERR